VITERIESFLLSTSQESIHQVFLVSHHGPIKRQQPENFQSLLRLDVERSAEVIHRDVNNVRLEKQSCSTQPEARLINIGSISKVRVQRIFILSPTCEPSCKVRKGQVGNASRKEASRLGRISHPSFEKLDRSFAMGVMDDRLAEMTETFNVKWRFDESFQSDWISAQYLLSET